LVYGELLYGTFSGYCSNEEPCFGFGLILLEKAIIFLWLKIYKRRCVPKLDVFRLEMLDELEVMGLFFGRTPKLS
jgi:hypothetical protein